MGSFVVYVLEWALCLSAFLLLYKMCFSGSTFHRFNRYFLLGSIVVSALLPLIHITTSEQLEPIAEVCRLNTEQIEPVVSPLPMQVSVAREQLTTGQKVFVVFALTYLIYVAVQIVGWLKSLVKMVLFLRGKQKRKVGRWFICFNYSFLSDSTGLALAARQLCRVTTPKVTAATKARAAMNIHTGTGA